MRRGLISADTHGAVEPLMAILFIAAPWLFGFSETDSATAISVAVGVIMLLAGAMTQWRYSLVKLIPQRMHFMTDLAIGAFLILAPFIFGFSDEGGATRFLIIAGVAELLATLSTRWELDQGPARARGRTAAARS
jgi:hypothetical protein